MRMYEKMNSLESRELLPPWDMITISGLEESDNLI